MRWTFGSLPWERLGDRAVLITLTYPGDWERWVWERGGRTRAQEFERHRQVFSRAWRRHWGCLEGVWVKEFQASGRPHLHLYVGLPVQVSVAEFEALRERTIEGKELEAALGTFEGRRLSRPIGQEQGPFSVWLLRTWSRVVGTVGTGERHEKTRC